MTTEHFAPLRGFGGLVAAAGEVDEFLGSSATAIQG
jgi:hypothetical protein